MPQSHRSPRGHIRELPSGSFQAIAYSGRDPLTGKLRYERETTKTYQAAEVAPTRLQNQVDEDRHPKSDPTVRQAIDQWLEVAQLEDTTRDRYDDLIRIYIDPTLGKIKAAKLDAQMLERWYARLQRCRSCDGRRVSGHACRPLSSSTVRKIHFIVSAALGRAVRWDQIAVNRAELAEAPSPAATEPDPPTAAEAARLLSEAWAADPDWGLLLWLTVVTGSRRGEISAVRPTGERGAGAAGPNRASRSTPRARLPWTAASSWSPTAVSATARSVRSEASARAEPACVLGSAAYSWSTAPLLPNFASTLPRQRPRWASLSIRYGSSGSR